MSSADSKTPHRSFQKDREMDYFFGLISSHWMMTPAERLAIFGLLHLLRPDCALEIGYGYGEFTYQLSKIAREVHTVDIHERVILASNVMQNTRGWHMRSQEAFKLFAQKGMRFDFCLIDGEHSGEAAYSDLKAALKMSHVIVLHDTSNPSCRSGYVRCLNEHNVYANLDWVDGRIQVDGPWGGLGIVLPSHPKDQRYEITPTLKSNFELIEKELALRPSG